MTNTLTTFDLTHPLSFEDVRREMGRMFSNEGNKGDWFSPSMDLSETDDAYEVSVDLPGVSPDDISIEMRNGELWIQGERKHREEKKNKKFHRIEQRHGHFRRMIRLGDDVDADKVDAEYRDGVLHVSIPRNEAARPKRISIRK